MINLIRTIFKKCLFLLTILLTISILACMDTTETTESIVTTHDYLCSFNIAVEISNGIDQIDTHYVPCVAYGTDPDNQFTADGFCNIYDMIENLDSLPSIEQKDTMDLNKSNTVLVLSINVYSSDGTLLETWDSWEARSTLEPGQYFIRLSVNKGEDHCVVSGHSIFVLNVN